MKKKPYEQKMYKEKRKRIRSGCGLILTERCYFLFAVAAFTHLCGQHSSVPTWAGLNLWQLESPEG